MRRPPRERDVAVARRCRRRSGCRCASAAASASSVSNMGPPTQRSRSASRAGCACPASKARTVTALHRVPGRDAESSLKPLIILEFELQRRRGGRLRRRAASIVAAATAGAGSAATVDLQRRALPIELVLRACRRGRPAGCSARCRSPSRSTATRWIARPACLFESETSFCRNASSSLSCAFSPWQLGGLPRHRRLRAARSSRARSRAASCACAARRPPRAAWPTSSSSVDEPRLDLLAVEAAEDLAEVEAPPPHPADHDQEHDAEHGAPRPGQVRAHRHPRRIDREVLARTAPAVRLPASSAALREGRAQRREARGSRAGRTSGS